MSGSAAGTDSRLDEVDGESHRCEELVHVLGIGEVDGDRRGIEHFTDSGGKSGGQKEKLAYTILAAALAFQFGLGSGKGACSMPAAAGVSGSW